MSSLLLLFRKDKKGECVKGADFARVIFITGIISCLPPHYLAETVLSVAKLLHFCVHV
jgi:hypothetical protein